MLNFNKGTETKERFEITKEGYLHSLRLAEPKTCEILETIRSIEALLKNTTHAQSNDHSGTRR